MHTRLLKAYNPEDDPWVELQHDGYLYHYLVYHLKEAGKFDELCSLLFASFDWMERKFDTFMGDTSYVSDLELIRSELTDPLTPSQLLHLVQIQVARGVARQRAQKFTDADLETLVLLERETEALSYAHLRPTSSECIQSLLVINATQRETGEFKTEIIQEAIKLLPSVKDQTIQSHLIRELVINLAKSGNFTEAEKTARGLSIVQARIDTLCELATIMAQASQDRKADILFNELLEQAPAHKREEQLAQALIESERLALAKQVIQGIADDGIGIRIKVLTRLGRAYADKKQPTAARSTLDEARSLLQQAGHNYKRLEWLTELGIAFSRANHEDEASDVFVEAMEMAKSDDDLQRLALAYARAGCVFTEKAGDTARRISENDWRRVSSLCGLAVAFNESGNFLRAREVFSEAQRDALHIPENSWHREAALSRLANSYARANLISEASVVFNELAGLARTIPGEIDSNIWDDSYSPTYDWLSKPAGDERPRARRAMAAASNKINALIEFGNVLTKHGMLKRAGEIFIKALEVARGIVSDRGRSKVLILLAPALSQIGRKTTAEAVFAEAREIITRDTFQVGRPSIHNPRANAISDLALGLERAGNKEEAIRTFEEAEKIASAAVSLRYLAERLAEAGYFDEATRIAQNIIDSIEFGAIRQQAIALQSIAVDMADRGLFSKAKEVIGLIHDDERVLRAWALSYLSIELAKAGFYEKAATALNESKKEAWSHNEADAVAMLAKQAVASVQLGREDEATQLFDAAWQTALGIDYGPFAHKDKPLAQSRVARELAQVHRFAQAREAIQEIDWFEVRSPAESYLLTKLAEAGRFAEFIELIDKYGFGYDLDALLLTLVGRSAAFNSLEQRLEISALREATRIAGWARHDWHEVHILFTEAGNEVVA